MIFRGPYPDITIPEVSLTDFIFSSTQEIQDKPALIDGPSGRVLTYAQLEDAVRRVAASLAQRGFKKGDVLGIFSVNCPEYGVLFHAVAMLGGINTTLNPLYTAEEAAAQLKDAGAKILVTAPPFIEKAREAAESANIKELFVFGEAEGAIPFASLLESDGNPPKVEINPRQDLVALPYSSGTTGLPKGVMLTHYNLVANMRQMDGLDYFHRDDTLLCVLPLFHIYGLVVVLNMGLHTGATVVTMPRFELEQFLGNIQKYRVTLSHIVPPIILKLAKEPVVDNYDFSTLKTIFSGAAPLGAELTRECIERIGCTIRQGYGLTETTPVTHTSPADSSKMKLGSIGPPAPNTECKLVDPATGAQLGPNQEGEVCVRGPQVMRGYLNNPEATARTIDADGWLHTGDIGYADDDGHFYIVDRVKELIKYKGFQIAPAELEAVLVTHPAVADAAVIPLADDEAGEVPKAFVVLKGEASAEEIKEFVSARIAPYKKIREIEFIDQIPKSLSGKILRRVLVEKERAKAKGAMEPNNAMSEQVAPDRISRAVRAYFLAIRAMDPEAIANTFAEDGTTYDPVGSAGVTGRDAIREFFSSIYKNFKSVTLTEDSIFVAGNGAAVKWTGKGTSANGKNVNFEGIDVVEVDPDGKIRTVHGYWNPAEMIAQL